MYIRDEKKNPYQGLLKSMKNNVKKQRESKVISYYGIHKSKK